MQLEKVFELEDLSRNSGSSDRYVQDSRNNCSHFNGSLHLVLGFCSGSFPLYLTSPKWHGGGALQCLVRWTPL